MYDFNAMRERARVHAAEWRGMLAEGPDGERPRLTSDTAIVQATRKAQDCEQQFDRIDALEAVQELTDDADMARAQSRIAAMEGSHGPAQQWLRLAHEIEESRRAAQAQAELHARLLEDPAAFIVELATQLQAVAQSAPALRPFIGAVAEAALVRNEDVTGMKPDLQLVNG